MAMLSFMPWCPIDQAYKVGNFEIIPFVWNQPIEGLDRASIDQVRRILSAYKKIDGNPIEQAALVRFLDKGFLADLNEEEKNKLRDFVSLACFSSLSKRDYFSLGFYSNSDCFSFYFQKFEKGDFTAISTRRMGEVTLSGWPIDEVSISVPVHCHQIKNVSLDESLLESLNLFQEFPKNRDWGKWQNSISCFNQANSDSENFLYQTEWVLLCGAFEHILNANSNAKDVATKFSEALVPENPLKAKEAERQRSKEEGKNKNLKEENDLRFVWMREFYRIRGDFAHGNLKSSQPADWNPSEHLVLAKIVFPLLVKNFLSKMSKKGGNYKLTVDDLAQIESFEKFAGTQSFLKPPQDQENSFYTHWKQILDQKKHYISMREAMKEAEEQVGVNWLIDQNNDPGSLTGSNDK